MATSELASSMEHIRAGTYTCAAGGTVLLFDMMLTLGDEIRLIWPSRFSLVKSLYFINRYFPVPCLLLGMYHLAGFHNSLSTNVRPLVLSFQLIDIWQMCKLIILSQLVGQAFALIAATWLLVLRVRALYTSTPWVSYSLYAVFAITHGLTFIMASVIFHNMWPSVSYARSIHLCVATPSKRLALVYYPPILCEAYLVALTIYHAKQYARALHPLLSLRTLRPNITLPTFRRPTNPFRNLSSDKLKTTTENESTSPRPTSPTSPGMVTDATRSPETPQKKGSRMEEAARSKCLFTRTGAVAAMTTTPILRTLYADGFAYFIVVVGLRLWTAFTFTFADESYWYTSTYLEFGLISTSVSRLVLHLRGAAMPSENDLDSEGDLGDEDDVDECECQSCSCDMDMDMTMSGHDIPQGGGLERSTISRTRRDEEEGRVGLVSGDWEKRRTIDGFPTQMPAYSIHSISRRGEEKEDARRAPLTPKRSLAEHQPRHQNPHPQTRPHSTRRVDEPQSHRHKHHYHHHHHHHHHHHQRTGEKKKRKARNPGESYGAHSSVHFEPGLGSREIHTRGSIDEIGIPAPAPHPRQKGKTRGKTVGGTDATYVHAPHVGARTKRDEMGRIVRPPAVVEEDEDVWNMAEGDEPYEEDDAVIKGDKVGEEWVQMHKWRGGDGFVK